MLYNVTKLTKRLVPAGKQNAGTQYIEVTIEDPEDGEERVVPVFDNEAKRYGDLIPTAALDTTVQLPDATPDNMKVWKNCFDKEFVFPETMVRVNQNGQPDFNKYGSMRKRNSVMVMTRYKKDNETGELTPRRGWDLATRGTSVMNAFYRPEKDIVAASFTGVAPVPTPEQQIATQPGQAPAMQPGVTVPTA